MKFLPLIGLFCSINFANGQTFYHFSLQDKILLNQQLTDAVGNKLTILNFTIGDISRDGRKDVIAIAENENDKNENRKVFLFINKKNSLFELRAVNDKIIECAECGGGGVGDPYQKTVITKNYFSFEMLYGDCDKENRIVTFQFDPKLNDFFLHRDVSQTYNCKRESNFQNKIIIKETLNNVKHFKKLKFKDYKLSFDS